MEFYDITFFERKDRQIKFHFKPIPSDKSLITGVISEFDKDWESPHITLFFLNEQSFINFKNSVISEYEHYRRWKEEVKACQEKESC